MLGIQDQKWHNDQAAKRIAAEDAAAHKKVWGEEMASAEEMGDINLGDNYHYENPGKGTFGKLAGQAVLAAALVTPLAAVAWKYLDRPVPDVVVPADTDTVTELRILRPQ